MKGEAALVFLDLGVAALTTACGAAHRCHKRASVRTKHLRAQLYFQWRNTSKERQLLDCVVRANKGSLYITSLGPNKDPYTGFNTAKHRTPIYAGGLTWVPYQK